MLPIRDLKPAMSVWSRDEATGAMGWKRIEAQYYNTTDTTVSVTIRDLEGGAEQTIVSNRIHPYFVQTTRAVPASSEVQVYTGDLPNGHWVDAAHLAPGDRLLNDDASWAEVVTVGVEARPLTAYNLTVADFHTYFVAANTNAAPVWVHNADCFEKVDFDVKRLPQERQDAVNDTLIHINAGTTPTGPTGERWGRVFQNNPRKGQTKRDLPKYNAEGDEITYKEFRVAPRPGQTDAGTDRIVVGSDGRRYYTGTHYGTGENYPGSGNPFKRIK